MKNLCLLMFIVTFFSVSAVYAEGENLTDNSGSFCEEGGKTPASLEIRTASEEATSTGSTLE